jgi:hypothetical protein
MPSGCELASREQRKRLMNSSRQARWQIEKNGTGEQHAQRLTCSTTLINSRQDVKKMKFKDIFFNDVIQRSHPFTNIEVAINRHSMDVSHVTPRSRYHLQHL